MRAVLVFALAFVGLNLWKLKAADKPLDVVPSVDLQRYAGKWYEIARLPNWFQRSCAGDVTATYALRPDGKISVTNECRTAEGKLKSAKGTAKLADRKGPNSKLSVSFFWPFSGKYWILDLDPDYKWALVGEPGRDYFWILSREPKMADDVYRSLLDKAAQKGFDTSRVTRTRNSG